MKSGNPRAFWDTIRKLQGEQKKQDEITLKIAQGTTNDQRIIAEEFAMFFENKVKTLSDNIGPYQWARSETSINITEADLDKAIKGLKSKLCSGHDDIPLKIIKHGAPAIKEQLVRLMNIATQNIPTDWKRAVIKPLHKTGSKTITQNYRPIANLVSISKLFEKIILEKIDVKYPEIEGQAQHGFRKNRSTLTALLELQHAISDAMDKNQLVSTYSIDMTAAFDLLRPNIFHKNTDIEDPIMNVLIDFMTNRTFRVKVGENYSTDKALNVGCVQGSILGPKLFNIYCNGISKNIPEDASLIIYADDSYVVNTAANIEDLKTKTELCMNTHAKYLASLGMKVNAGKTEMMLSSRNLSVNKIEIQCDNATVKNQRHMKALGIIFTDDLTWKKQIDTALQRSAHTVRRIRFLSKWLQKPQLLQLVTSQYLPVIFYCSQLWTGCLDSSSWKRIVSSHYRAIRAALKIYNIRRYGRQELNSMSGRATPVQWTNYALASSVIKLYNNSDTTIAKLLRDSAYINDRMPFKAKFTDRSKYKIGKQSMPNRISHLFATISFDWITQMTNDNLRILLKNEFFK